MRLNEYQTKQLFARYGVPIPRGRVASTSREVAQITEELGGQVVIKAQVLVHGRGRLGGIRIARSTQEAELQAMRILGSPLGNHPVNKVLVDELISFHQQFYISIRTDYTNGLPHLTASTIVHIGENNGNGSHKENTMELWIDPLFGISEFQVRDIALHLDLPAQLWQQLHTALSGLWMVYWECDAQIAEINPLIVSNTSGLIALDGEVELDDKALFRHIDLSEMRDYQSESILQVEARKYGFDYTALNGTIGTISNGAGLAISTVDTILYMGGSPANFLDSGPCHTPEKASMAILLSLKDPNAQLLLVNIYGGISNCTAFAQGLLQNLDEDNIHIPVILRVSGEGADEARKILTNTTVEIFDDFTLAIQRSIALVASIKTGGENI